MDESKSSTNIVGPVDAGWTVVTLKEYTDTLFEVSERARSSICTHYDVVIHEIDRRYEARFLASEIAVSTSFSAQEKAISAALAAASAAVNKAEVASEKRFESVNEFRAQLGDQQRTFMPRAEVEVIVRALNEALSSALTQLRSMIPRAEHESAVKALTDKYDALVSRFDRIDNRNQGGQQVWGYVFGAVGVMVGIAGLVLALFR
jgi:hypothetical protein